MVPHLTTALTGPLLALDTSPNRFHAYGVVARLAQFAASLEFERTAP